MDTNIKVTDVQVMDDISAVDKKRFSDFGLEKYVDVNGAFIPYERRTVIRGDGKETLDEWKKEMTKKKFVYLTLEITATRDGEEMGLADQQIMFLENMSETIDEEMFFEEPVYFDASPLKNTESHYFWFTLDAGETKTCHLGYLIDEDRLDKMYLTRTSNGNEYALVDIRQK